MRRSGRAGFTLLEVAIALAILGVGVVTCLQLFSGSLDLQRRAARGDRAVLHARATMDALLFQPEITNQTREFTTADGLVTRVEVRRAGAAEGVPQASDLDFLEDIGLRYLQVDVSWREGSGVRSYTLRSMRVAAEDE